MPSKHTTQSSNQLWIDPLQGKDVLPKHEDLVEAVLEKLHQYLAKNTVGKIVKAWSEGGLIDGSGKVWLDTAYLPQVIRTSPWIARKRRNEADDCDLVRFSGTTYLSGSAILYILDEVITRAGISKRRLYAQLSENLCKDIRDSAAAKERQTLFERQMKDTRSKLKRDRIRLFSVDADELTGEELDRRSAEFSHILSASYYFEFSDKVWNGLVVNKPTHELITQKNVADDKELLVLCKEQGWKRDWLKDFNKHIRLQAA